MAHVCVGTRVQSGSGSGCVSLWLFCDRPSEWPWGYPERRPLPTTTWGRIWGGELLQPQVPCFCLIYIHIPPALWARGGLEVVSIKPIKPSPYPLPGSPIRPVWKTRGRTSLSLNSINYPARASKSAMLTKSSSSPTAFVIALAWRFIYFRENEQNQIFMFFHLIFTFSATPPAGHRRPP